MGQRVNGDDGQYTVKKINILMVGPPGKRQRDVERALADAENFVGRIWHCQSIPAAIGVADDLLSKLDVILLNGDTLTCDVDAMASFRALDSCTGLVPVVVFDGPLLLPDKAALIEAGADDTISRAQFRFSHMRLRSKISKAIGRARAARRRHVQLLSESENRLTPEQLRAADIQRRLQNVRNENVELRERNHRIRSVYAEALQQRESELRDKEEIIHWLSGDYALKSSPKD